MSVSYESTWISLYYQKALNHHLVLIFPNIPVLCHLTAWRVRTLSSCVMRWRPVTRANLTVQLPYQRVMPNPNVVAVDTSSRHCIPKSVSNGPYRNTKSSSGGQVEIEAQWTEEGCRSIGRYDSPSAVKVLKLRGTFFIFGKCISSLYPNDLTPSEGQCSPDAAVLQHQKNNYETVFQVK